MVLFKEKLLFLRSYHYQLVIWWLQMQLYMVMC